MPFEKDPSAAETVGGLSFVGSQSKWNLEVEAAISSFELSAPDSRGSDAARLRAAFEVEGQQGDAAMRVQSAFRRLIDLSGTTMLVIDGEMKITMAASASHAPFLRASDTSLLGGRVSDAIDLLDYPMIIEDAEATIKSASAMEREIRTRTGSYLSVRWRCTSAADDGVAGACVTINDITPLRMAYDVARRHERCTQLAEELGQLAVVALDETGCITHWNPGAVRLFQWREEEAIGGSCEMLYPSNASDGGPLASHLAFARAHGRATLNQMLSRKDGKTFRANGVIASLESAGFLHIARDDSEQMLITESVERTFALEEAVRLRVDAASRLKEEFLALISHELKHPLHLILSGAELLGRLPEAVEIPSVIRTADAIREAAETQAKIFDNLLDFSRLRTGKLGLRLSVFALETAVSSVVETFGAQAQSAEINFRMDVEGAPLLMEGDRARVEQIVWNLVENALKFTPHGGHVALHLDRLKSGDIELIVRDSGQGIEPEFQGRIFDAFSQEDSGIGRSGYGMGIGLALVRNLVHAHKGEVLVRSSGRGKGAIFTVILPGLFAARTFTESTAARNSSLAGMRLLLVDDSRKSVELIASALRLEGGEVDTAYNGAEALRFLQCKPYDVLVSDLGMPEMSGYELIVKIRRLNLCPRPSAIAFSGYSQKTDVERALSAGFDKHLSKPASLTKLKAAIASVRLPAATDMLDQRSRSHPP